MRQLIDGFYSLYPQNYDRYCCLFLDEIQNVEDWALVIRYYVDTKKVQIYLSGSSAKLLSKEIATSLRGRSLVTEVWPFSFKEYLHAKNIISVSKNMLYEYLNYFEDAYLIFSVPLYSRSVRKTRTNPRKIYVIDSGLSNAYSLKFYRDFGHHFENLAYLDLRRKGHKIYYYLTKERNEVDFFTKDLSGKTHLYQVVWNIDDNATMMRESRSL